MLELFSRISIPHFAEHKLRTALTVFGVSLGVAATVGLQLTFQPITRAIHDAVEQVSGRAVLRLANGEAGVPEELVEQVKHISRVRAASASVQGFVPVAGHPGERLFVFGVDFLEDRKVRDYDFSPSPGTASQAQFDDPLVFLAKADSVALTRDFAMNLGAKLGDRIQVQAPSGLRPLTVRGILDGRRGPAAVFGGRIALMDIFAAQRLFQMNGRFTQIDISMNPGTDIDKLEAALRQAAAGRASVQREEEQLKTIEFALKLQQTNLAGISNLALLLGIYLIFNTMIITVAQRWREIGILRALGMRRRSVIGMIFAESIFLGVAGGILGIPLGVWLARPSSQALLLVLGGNYMPPHPPRIELQAGPMVSALVAGVTAAALGAVVPALQAVVIHPLEAIRRARVKKERPRGYAIAAAAGLACAGLALAVVEQHSSEGDSQSELGRFVLAISICFVGVLLITPFLMRVVVRRTETLLSPAGSIAALAGRGMANNIGRVALTGTAFVASTVFAVLVICMIRSVNAQLDEGFSAMLNGADLVVVSGTGTIGRGLRMPESLVSEIAALDGVSNAIGARTTKVEINSNSFQVVPIDVPIEGFRFKEGDASTAIEGLKRGDGVILDAPCAHRLHAHLGTQVGLDAPGGRVNLRTVGVVQQASENGGMFIPMTTYRHYWRDTTVNMIFIWLKPGAKPEATGDAIRRNWGATHELFVLSANAFLETQREFVDRAIGLMMPVVFIAVVIALFGLMNSLFASVIDRVREIGLTRAVGGTARQVARLVTIEAMTLGLIAGALSIPLGIWCFYFDVLTQRVMLGNGIFFRLPSLTVALLIVGSAAILAGLAGYLPGREAAKIRVTEAVQME